MMNATEELRAHLAAHHEWGTPESTGDPEWVALEDSAVDSLMFVHDELHSDPHNPPDHSHVAPPVHTVTTTFRDVDERNAWFARVGFERFDGYEATFTPGFRQHPMKPWLWFSTYHLTVEWTE